MFLNISNKAISHIRGSKKHPKIDGLVTFKETKDGVLLTAKIKNLPTSNTNCKRKILWFSYS